MTLQGHPLPIPSVSGHLRWPQDTTCHLTKTRHSPCGAGGKRGQTELMATGLWAPGAPSVYLGWVPFLVGLWEGLIFSRSTDQLFQWTRGSMSLSKDLFSLLCSTVILKSHSTKSIVLCLWVLLPLVFSDFTVYSRIIRSETRKNQSTLRSEDVPWKLGSIAVLHSVMEPGRKSWRSPTGWHQVPWNNAFLLDI